MSRSITRHLPNGRGTKKTETFVLHVAFKEGLFRSLIADASEQMHPIFRSPGHQDRTCGLVKNNKKLMEGRARFSGVSLRTAAWRQRCSA